MELEKDDPPQGFHSTNSDNKQTDEKHTGTRRLPSAAAEGRKTGEGWGALGWRGRSSEPGFSTHHLFGLS